MVHGSATPRITRGLGFSVLLSVLALGCKTTKPQSNAAPSAEHDRNETETVAVGPDPKASAELAPLPAPPDVGGPPSDAARAPSGLATKILAPGNGKKHPAATERVRIHYTGWKKDGTMFDSTVRKRAPVTLDLERAIPGFREALPLMVEGEKLRLWVPATLAYGERASLAGQPAGDLVFDLELVAIVKAPESPKDLKVPPADATKTDSGLAYKRLNPGTGKQHPTAQSRVQVHYSGWTRDGKLFDSTVVDGAPTSFALSQAIRGYAEGVQLMVVGEKTRFWIPARLAYGDKPTRPGVPAGDLVFDIELLAIEP